jgi:hypothetical protein
MRLVTLCSVVVALASCGGGGGFGGTFTGTVQGKPVILVLRTEGAKVSGTIRWMGTEAQVSGTIDGNRMAGTVRHPEHGFEAPFEATLEDDTIDWVYTFTNQLGEKNRFPFLLTRGDRAAPEDAEPGGSLDPQLVGRWFSDVGGTGESAAAGTTRLRCAFNADGTFEYSGADTVILHRDGLGSPGGAEPGLVLRGRWKTEGRILSWCEEHGSWTALGNYTVSGGDLVIYADGAKYLWRRQ